MLLTRLKVKYVVKKGKMCYTEYEVTRMLEVPVYNLFVKFGEHIFQTSAATTWEQTVNKYVVNDFY
jgi:hypothetical protein